MRTLITVIVVILAAAVFSEVLLNHHPIKAVIAALAPAASEPQAAFEQAMKAEQQLTAENLSAIIAKYRQVIALQPDSEWAGKARVRIEVLEARIKAEELRQSDARKHRAD